MDDVDPPLASVLAPILATRDWNNGFYQQHLADARCAETATAGTKPISLAFALAGLYLMVEHHLDGRQVQNAHHHLSHHKRAVPRLRPAHAEVEFGLEALAETPTEPSFHRWCQAVWRSYAEQHDVVRRWVDSDITL